jgi:hypothetical protein
MTTPQSGMDDHPDEKGTLGGKIKIYTNKIRRLGQEI